MIIVKTSNGDVLFNDKEIVRLRHDKENHFVYVTRKDDGKGIGTIRAIHNEMTVEKVENVIYINDTTGTERKDDGYEVVFLRQQLADEKNMTGFLCTLAEGIEKKLLNFASDIIQMVQYDDEIPDESRRRLRDHAEESKDWELDKGRWWERQEYLEKHQKQVEAEVAHTSMLNEKVEQQAFRIVELEANLDQTKGRLKFIESENKYLHEHNNALENRNLWQRIFNLIP